MDISTVRTAETTHHFQDGGLASDNCINFAIFELRQVVSATRVISGKFFAMLKELQIEARDRN